MDIGFIGLGVMGTHRAMHVATHLATHVARGGHRLKLLDLGRMRSERPAQGRRQGLRRLAGGAGMHYGACIRPVSGLR